MKNLTVLRVVSSLYLLIVLFYTVIYYKELSTGEGWGVAFMMAYAGVGLAGLAMDEILKWAIKDRKAVNIFEATVLVGLSLFLVWAAVAT